MRWLFAVLVMALSWTDQPGQAADFPYKAAVRKADTQVRSGPGKSYYVTQKLDEGATVEVYRHDPGGWCAVRPPDGSFSWIRSRYLDVGEDNIATINAEEVVARVGSSVVDARDVIQVHLEQDEAVELVDGDEEKHGSWRKVAPPSGEFRWVPLDSLERLEDAAIAAEYKLVERIDQKSENLVRVGYEDEGSPVLGPADETMPDGPQSATSRRRRMSHAAVQQEIIDIDLELSKRSAEDISTWVFDDLIERAERALEGAPTALDRAAVRELMGKIDRFERISEQHTDVQIAQSKLSPMQQFAAEGNFSPSSEFDTSRFDGVGTLAQVPSRQKGMPQYALVDAAGKVRYYLAPSPGINLKPFLNKQVGINGTRGALAAKQRQVINTQRVTELPTGTRRY